MDRKPSLHFYITSSLKEATWIHAFHKYICVKVNKLAWNSFCFSVVSQSFSVVSQSFSGLSEISPLTPLWPDLCLVPLKFLFSSHFLRDFCSSLGGDSELFVVLQKCIHSFLCGQSEPSLHPQKFLFPSLVQSFYWSLGNFSSSLCGQSKLLLFPQKFLFSFLYGPSRIPFSCLSEVIENCTLVYIVMSTTRSEPLLPHWLP